MWHFLGVLLTIRKTLHDGINLSSLYEFEVLTAVSSGMQWHVICRHVLSVGDYMA
jgi:hypothetical protein